MKNIVNKLNGRTHASIYISSLWRVQTESQGRFAKKYKYIKQVQTKSQKHCLIAIGGASILPGCWQQGLLFLQLAMCQVLVWKQLICLFDKNQSIVNVHVASQRPRL